MAGMTGTVGNTMRVYVDGHKTHDQHSISGKENVDGWHRSPIRQGVTDGNNESQEFLVWKSRCLGRVVLQSESVDEDGNYIKIPWWFVYLETQEDLVSYILTFEEPVPWIQGGEAAAFYCPYVPLIHVKIAAPPHDDGD